MIDLLILTVCQLVEGYSVTRGGRIVFISTFLCSCIVRVFFFFVFCFFLHTVLSNTIILKLINLTRRWDSNKVLSFWVRVHQGVMTMKGTPHSPDLQNRNLTISGSLVPHSRHLFWRDLALCTVLYSKLCQQGSIFLGMSRNMHTP